MTAAGSATASHSFNCQGHSSFRLPQLWHSCLLNLEKLQRVSLWLWGSISGRHNKYTALTLEWIGHPTGMMWVQIWPRVEVGRNFYTGDLCVWCPCCILLFYSLSTPCSSTQQLQHQPLLHTPLTARVTAAFACHNSVTHACSTWKNHRHSVPVI